MVFFKILLNRILKKFPLKFLLIILIILLLFFMFKINCYAVDYDYYFTSSGVGYNYQKFEGLSVVIGYLSTGAPRLCLFLPGSSTINYDYIPFEDLGNGNISIKNISSDYWNYRVYSYNSNTGVYEFGQYGQVLTNAVGLTDAYIIISPNLPVKDYINQNLYLNANTYNYRYVDHFVAPKMITESNRIDDWSFYNLIFDSGSITAHYGTIDGNIPYRLRSFELEITYQGQVYTKDLYDYMYIYDSSTDLATFNVPKQEIFNFANVYSGNSVQFDLIVTPDDNPNSTGNWSSYSLGTYTLNLTTAEEEQYNSDSDKQVLGDINYGINNLNQSQQQTNNKLDNISDTLTDSSVSDMSSDFSDLSSGFEIQDPSGLEQVFQILYNAFCSDNIINLTFTIPFVNKQVTISSANISARYPQVLVSTVNIFVWGFVGLWVLKDIRSTVNKIAEGNAENSGSDIKKEVL